MRKLKETYIDATSRKGKRREATNEGKYNIGIPCRTNGGKATNQTRGVPYESVLRLTNSLKSRYETDLSLLIEYKIPLKSDTFVLIIRSIPDTKEG